MFSLQKILSNDDTFFDLLEASAEEARHSVQVLNRLLSAPNNIPSLQEFHLAKQADKKITDRINQALVSTFVTQLDREDIETLSGTLYKVPKRWRNSPNGSLSAPRWLKKPIFRSMSKCWRPPRTRFWP